MEPAVDPFHPLLRLLERYRTDVHYLRPPPPEAAIGAVQEHLRRKIPPSLKLFLKRWNGATLFRGALRVRGVADLAPPSPETPEVILFADGPGDDDRWAFAETPWGHHFGRWDGARLVPLHEHFNRWLLGQARVLDENLRGPEDQLRVRLEVDPENALLLAQLGEQALHAGDHEGAVKAFRRATTLDPNHALAWQRLGEALLAEDRREALNALLMSLRACLLPVPYPGWPVAERGLVRTLEHLFPAGDPGLTRELGDLVGERCTDVRHPEGAGLYESAALALARARLARFDRVGAREVLLRARERATSFTLVPDLPELHLQLISLHTDLGDHDDAEEVLRRLRRAASPTVLARAELILARVALLREEPWVEEIVRDALPSLKDAADKADAWLILAEAGGTRRNNPNEGGALDNAARLVQSLGDRVREARLELLRGDAARGRGDKEAAEQHYRACDGDAESACRARVRLGDLREDPAVALPFYVEAVEGYKALQLPVREAWARLRLVRCGDASQAEQALRALRSAGLAAGVAAADALMGKPGNSLDWHLSLATEHARQRYDAQRMRPPLVRADADRPERRILAHRRAIAACDERVVAALAADVQVELRKIQQSDGRTRDPAAMRFVAGVDLLAGHPSWAAAKVMLGLLSEDLHQDVAARALVGAMARSPNMTLVDGLMRALDEVTEPRALAMAIEILGWRRQVEAAPRLRRFVLEGSSPLRKAAIVALGRMGDLDAVDPIEAALDTPELAEAASVALLLLGSRLGVDWHGQALARDVAGPTQNPGELVGRYGGPSYLLLLLHAADREGPAALGALAGLGLLGNVRGVRKLIDNVGSRDSARQAVAAAALELMLGHREDLEDSHPRQKWEAWWEENSAKFEERVRWRRGAPHSVRSLVDRLADDDPALRTTTYDELVIATGVRLPFDADGPWRMQLQHRAAWSRWWADHHHELPDSGWLFHGEPAS